MRHGVAPVGAGRQVALEPAQAPALGPGPLARAARAPACLPACLVLLSRLLAQSGKLCRQQSGARAWCWQQPPDPEPSACTLAKAPRMCERPDMRPAQAVHVRVHASVGTAQPGTKPCAFAQGRNRCTSQECSRTPKLPCRCA